MFNDDYSDEEEATNLDVFRQPVSYNFNAELFDFQSFDEAIHERDEVLASEIQQYYPELSEWSQRALATAWRRFSKVVGSVEEEYVCARLPNFLAYLFVNQENWPVEASDWVNALEAAKAILWPSSKI